MGGILEGRTARGFQKGDVMCAMDDGCVLEEEDISNIHKFSMNDWNKRWIECQSFPFLIIFGSELFESDWI
jgi:hypothetical protein